MADTLIDGNYLRATPVGAPRWEYPFRRNGDRVTGLFEQEFWQTVATFTPQEFPIPHETCRDCYLIDETPPVEFLAGLFRFVRTYSRIPARQTVPGSRFVTKPELPGTFPQVSGDALIIKPDENVSRWIFYTNKAVSSDSGVPSGNVPTGGTYTVTIGANTTAGVAYNASAGTLQTALNGLASVSNRGSVTVTGSYTAGFVVTFDTFAAGSANGASLTGISGFSGVSTSVIPGQSNFLITLNVLNASSQITGGTFTVTVFGQTTAAIAYNATTATVLTAFQALSNVGSSGVSVLSLGVGSGYPVGSILRNGNQRISFYLVINHPTLTASGASLTPTGSAVTPTLGPNTDTQVSLSFTGVNLGTRILQSVAHGITESEDIVLTQGAEYRTILANSFETTSDTIILTASSSADAFNDATAITFVGKQNGSTYTADTKLTRVKRVTDFYLVGVSPGIASIDDVPLPTYEGDPAGLLAAIFAGSTDINFEVGELEYWRGPILQRTRTTLNAATL